MHRFCLLAILISGIALGFVRPGDEARAGDAAGSPHIRTVRVGFDGKYKVGHWTPVWISIVGGAQDVRGRLELTTPDGDGVRVTYVSAGDPAVNVPAGSEVTVLRYIKFGRTRGDLTVRLVADDRELTMRSFSSSELPPPLLSTHELILSLGQPIGIEEAVRRKLRSESQRIAVCRVERPDQLPRHWQGYEGVNTVVATTSEVCPLEQMDDEQFAAFQRWVQLGGRLILCVGRRGEEVFREQNRLARFAPGGHAKVIPQRITSGLENYAGATERLESVGAKRIRRFGIAMTEFAEVRGLVACSEIGPSGRFPTIVRFPHGLGEIVFVAFDPDQPPFVQWQGRPGLVAKILRGETRVQRDEIVTDTRLGQGARLGYDDLVGQLRAALDQFQGVTRTRFSWVAGLIAVYILLIGPADYFLLKKLRRMHWTWLTLPVVVVGFCALPYLLANRLSGNRLHINHVDLVDIDVEDSLARGTAWTHIYNPTTQPFRLSLAWSLPATVRDRGSSGQTLTWQGLPGDGLGGLNTTATAALFSEPYTISHDANPSGDRQPEIAGMPIQVSGSKSLSARWWAEVELDVKEELTIDRNGLLSGRLANPLNVDLSDCIVVYENWVYPFRGALRPGETVSFGGVSPRNLEWHLTRRKVVDTKDVGKPWDQKTIVVPRIMEIMMLHEAAGGESYTGLTHRYQPYVDLSEHRRIGRAILVGRGAAPTSQLLRDGQSLGDYCDRHWTFYRLVFPVRKK
jgi:hypothetical protein